MQSQPYLVIEGTVAATRKVEVPADSGTRADGSAWERKAYAYQEVAVTTAAVLDGEPGPDALLTVRVDADQAVPSKGDTIRWGVTARIVQSYISGRYVRWVVYDRAVQLDAVARSLSAAKTA